MFQQSKPWNPKAQSYGRFWIDVPEAGRKQKTVTLGPCPTRSVARQRLRDYIEKSGVNSKELFHENTSPATTFRQQSDRWLEHVATRTRKPVKPASIAGWQQALNAWILPNIGDRLLSDVSNAVLRELIGKMMAAGLAPKTVVNYSQVVKMVVASAINDEGDQIYPRKWNHEFIGLPIVRKEKQRRPTVTQAELEAMLPALKTRYRMLVAVLAGTGLRIGEAFGLKVSDFSTDCRILEVRRSVWRGKEQDPKTANALRTIDVPEELAQVLRAYVAGRSGYVFCTSKGRPLMPRNVLRILHEKGKRVGFHAFRRHRLTWLRRNNVPKDLERLWMGHAPEEVGDLYSKLRDDVAFRQEWAEKAGLGFSVVTLLHEQVGSTPFEKAA